MKSAVLLAVVACCSSGTLLAQDPPAALKILGVLSTQLATCRLAHVTDKQELENDLASFRQLLQLGTISNVDYVELSQKAITRSSAKSTNGKCKAEAMAIFPETSRKLMAGLTGSALERNGKEALAQWMTTLEATSGSNFDPEWSKYSTLANLLKVELTLK